MPSTFKILKSEDTKKTWAHQVSFSDTCTQCLHDRMSLLSAKVSYSAYLKGKVGFLIQYEYMHIF